ncbi:LLM class F420-dependent oxidoreductase [Microbacterium sp. BK668]|uniref:LLM class F420-dependent oxidoreductase n=1 Tax=Microbacterium sp. BK668 TaxID=2512118 RepID=UPI00105F7799|nr:LLM class F420-dependent oxidoreductase [Microbacterium sp. BK668]TDN91849.1 F420-dependent oxidoreductase-like protein [Microbacterium sp. BK668]
MEYCIFVEPQLGASYGDQLAFAQAAERLGFDGFFRSDHYMRSGRDQRLPGPTDAWTTLAGLARETSRIRLGTLVSSVTFRHPGILAVQVAQVDEMSSGRVELGLGAGWMEQEHRAYGIPFPAKRFGILEEQLAIVTGLWRTPVDETFSFEGDHHRLEESPALPKPQQERVPVIVGGRGPRRTPELAARYATEFNLGFPALEEIPQRLANLRAACARVGRDHESLKLSLAMSTFAGADDAEIGRRAAKLDRTAREVRDGVNIVGDAAEIGERIARYAELGIQRVYFQLLDLQDLGHVEYLGAEVLPHLPR